MSTMHETGATACLDWVPKVGGPCVIRSPEGHEIAAMVKGLRGSLVRVVYPGLDRPLWLPVSEVRELL
jgi:hypothetical protein